MSPLFDPTEKAPPDEAMRLRMFLSCVDDYRALSSSLALPTGVNLVSRLNADDAYWRSVLHSAALRKFYAPRDQVALTKVLKALRQCVTVTPQVEAVLEAFAEQAEEVPSAVVYVVNGEPVSLWNLLEVDLYGRHLHADYGKWEASKRREPKGYLSEMVDWCNGAAGVALALSDYVRHLEQDGHLALNEG
ncbi:hypothetical protein [Agromyces sp. SYSU T00266]|uniref:hypothetical protein n=1 Tax=Agromyces zhanjiangensis TaxID=3158562 RepID=UPI00339192BE